MIKITKYQMKIYKILIKMINIRNVLNLKIKISILMEIDKNYNKFNIEITIHLKTYH